MLRVASPTPFPSPRTPYCLHSPEQAGGNDALALLLTVTTNLLGVVTVPFYVKAVVKSGDASIDGVQLLVKLVRLHANDRPTTQQYLCRKFQRADVFFVYLAVFAKL